MQRERIPRTDSQLLEAPYNAASLAELAIVSIQLWLPALCCACCVWGSLAAAMKRPALPVAERAFSLPI